MGGLRWLTISWGGCRLLIGRRLFSSHGLRWCRRLGGRLLGGRFLFWLARRFRRLFALGRRRLIGRSRRLGSRGGYRCLICRWLDLLNWSRFVWGRLRWRSLGGRRRRGRLSRLFLRGWFSRWGGFLNGSCLGRRCCLFWLLLRFLSRLWFGRWKWSSVFGGSLLPQRAGFGGLALLAF
ncbi:hypothetical protein X729_31855 [Mesorhizobium sp. L103C131B0]|nr:hypothetical protein X729_31855 [Mesorhizobium sp. L103C131B0]